MTTKVKSKPVKKWALEQDDYIKLLQSIDINAKAINELTYSVKKIRTRLGI